MLDYRHSLLACRPPHRGAAMDRGGVYTYDVQLREQPAPGVSVTVSLRSAANLSASHCELPLETIVFTRSSWNVNQQIRVSLNAERSFTAKDSVAYRCLIDHTATASDGTTYATKRLSLDAVSAGCGLGEYLGDFDRGTSGTECVCGVQYFLPPSSECLQCPQEESICEEIALASPVVRADWWRSNLSSPDLQAHPFYDCPYENACLQGHRNSTDPNCGEQYEARYAQYAAKVTSSPVVSASLAPQDQGACPL